MDYTQFVDAAARAIVAAPNGGAKHSVSSLSKVRKQLEKEAAGAYGVSVPDAAEALYRAIAKLRGREVVTCHVNALRISREES